MTNHMAEVAKMFGVELGEPFKIADDTHYDCQRYHRFTKNTGIEISDDGVEWKTAGTVILKYLLMGVVRIVKLPWKPKYGELYYAPHFTPYMCHCQILNWGQDEKFDNFLFSHGLVFKTEEEAVAMTKKFLMMAKEEQNNG